MTVAVPVKNGANFLGAAIESALAQTWTDLEVLVVDDGSDDGGATAAVARTFGERIRFIQQENKGVAGALNTALEAMTGEIFSWLSHDDLFEPGKTARQAQVWMEAGGRSDVAVFGDFRWIDEQGALTGEERAPHALLVERPAMAVFDGRVSGCTVFAPAALLRREGGFDEAARHVQDYRMWRRLARSGLLLHIPEPVARIRRHAGQDSQKPEAREEGERFWSEALADVTEVEAALTAGSAERFLRTTGEFLRYRSPNKRAADEALARADVCARDALVSVVLDVGPDREAGSRALNSILAQTHGPLEVLVVGAEPGVRAAESEKAGLGRSIVPVASDSINPLKRLRNGAALARGAYVALLRAPGVFRPDKITAQVSAMSAAGALWSHTSFVAPEGLQRSGAFTGRVFPEILGGGPIALSTVVVHRAIVAAGLLFADPDAPPDLCWIEIAARHDLLGLDEALADLARPEPLTETEAGGLLQQLETTPFYNRHPLDLARRRRSTSAAVQVGTASGPAIQGARADPPQAETR